MEWLDSIVGWFERNGDTIAKVGNVAKNVYSAFDQNNNRQTVRNGYMDILQQKLAMDQAQQQKELDFLNAQNAAAGSGSGGGSGINTAALKAEQKRALAARKKAFKAAKGQLEGVAASYQPFIDAGKAVMPKQVANYNQFLDDSQMLSHYLSGAVKKGFETPSTPASQIKIDPTAYRVAAPQFGGTVPSLAELLKRG